jgi:hypothetical protein
MISLFTKKQLAYYTTDIHEKKVLQRIIFYKSGFSGKTTKFLKKNGSSLHKLPIPVIDDQRGNAIASVLLYPPPRGNEP